MPYLNALYIEMFYRPSEAACPGEEAVCCGWKQLLPGMHPEISTGPDYMDLSEAPGKPTGGGEREERAGWGRYVGLLWERRI